jgi:DNA invertase Pin-like site-specific DNA recombinase
LVQSLFWRLSTSRPAALSWSIGLAAQRERPPPASSVPAPQPEPYIYVRVSTYLQKQKGFSLPHQFDLCREAARQAGIADVPAANRLHDADSGKNFQRTALQTLLDAVRAGHVSIVYCPKVARLGRNARDCLEILDMLHAHGVELVLVENHIDTCTPMGKLFFTLLAAFAEWESELIRERTMSGKMEKLEQHHEAGKTTSAGKRSTPYGLHYSAPAQKGQEGEWRRVPEQARWVRFMFEQTAQGKGGDTIATLLNERGIAGPRAAYWNDVTVRNIVKNTAYIGQLRRTIGGRDYTFAVPRIVEDELFRQANAMIAQNKQRSTRNYKHAYLLSSTRKAPLLKCRVCHEAGSEHVMGGLYKGEPKKDGSLRLYYRCFNRTAGERRQHTVSCRRIETAVWDALCAMLKDPTRVLANIRTLSDAASRASQDVAQQIDALTQKAQENRAAQARLAKLAALGHLADDVIAEQAAQLEDEASTIASRLALLRVQLQQAQDNTFPIREVEDACQLLAAGLDTVDFDTKRWIIRTLVTVIYADKDGWWMEGGLPCLNSSADRRNSSAYHESPGGEKQFMETPSSASSASPMRRMG